MQQQIFSLLGIDETEAQARFGFLLDAFRFGAPPHAGFAFGVDRLVALLAGEENIREVIAFPKTQSGADPLTGAPSAARRRAAHASSASSAKPKAPPEAVAHRADGPRRRLDLTDLDRFADGFPHELFAGSGATRRSGGRRRPCTRPAARASG